MKRRTLLAVALLLGAAPAAATSSFPEVIRDTLALDAAPGCMTCHTLAGGGAGTATKPVALSLVAAGLLPFNDASLETALGELEANGTDSDEDGVGDIDELRAGTDPNAPPGADGGPVPEPIQYGFGCAHAPPGSAVAFALLSLLVRRWRRAPCPRRSRTRTPARTSPPARLSPR